ncbi:MAG: hypothetical protein FJW14_17305, partial [Acidimicrobiia bacterium]|nr:hypothetical protein [Acidimicrobiia bacterium]
MTLSEVEGSLRAVRPGCGGRRGFCLRRRRFGGRFRLGYVRKDRRRRRFRLGLGRRLQMLAVSLDDGDRLLGRGHFVAVVAALVTLGVFGVGARGPGHALLRLLRVLAWHAQ